MQYLKIMVQIAWKHDLLSLGEKGANGVQTSSN